MNHESIELNLRRRIPYFHLLDQMKEKRKIKRKLAQFNRFLGSYGLNFKKIDICETEQNQIAPEFEINIEQSFPVVDKAALCQTARDAGLISEKSYEKLRKTIKPFAKLSSIYKCREYKKKVNQIWPIQTNSKGSFISNPIEKIKFVCQRFIQINSSEAVKDMTFKLLLCGDGVQITKTHINLLNFTFALLNDGDMSLNGQYTLGIFKIQKEDRASIEICLKEIIEKLCAINQININEKMFNIKFLVGGDLKWISNVFGIVAANGSYPCPWCTFKVEARLEQNRINETWSINGRNSEEFNECINKSNVDENKGYKAQILFPCIDYGDVVVDLLHMVLRITDKLLEGLLFRLQELEFDPNLDNADVNSPDWERRPLTKILADFIEFECKITHPFYIGQKNDSDSIIKIRKLNQNERFRMINGLFNERGRTLASIFPIMFNGNNIQRDMGIQRYNKLFKEFIEIIKAIKDFESFDKINLQERLRVWLKDFIRIEPKITPYIHIFCYHIPELIEKYSNLNIFSMQGMEKLNEFLKINFFRQTNRHLNEFPTILLEKINRKEFYHLKGKIN